MRPSPDRILTTHTGSLPRPGELRARVRQAQVQEIYQRLLQRTAAPTDLAAGVMFLQAGGEVHRIAENPFAGDKDLTHVDRHAESEGWLAVKAGCGGCGMH